MSSNVDRILAAMGALSAERAIFHSEADFQFALAWSLRRLNPTREIRLEFPFGKSERGAIDVVLLSAGKPSFALELKYVKARTELEWGGERFCLPDSTADGCYYACKDLARMERFVMAYPGASAAVIVLSNRALSWRGCSEARMYFPFRLTEGRTLEGTVDWPEHTVRSRLPGDMREPITLAGSYPLIWRDFGDAQDPSHTGFRYLYVEVAALASVSASRA